MGTLNEKLEIALMPGAEGKRHIKMINFYASFLAPLHIHMKVKVLVVQLCPTL